MACCRAPWSVELAPPLTLASRESPNQPTRSIVDRSWTFVRSHRSAKLQSVGVMFLAKQQMFPMSPRNFTIRGYSAKSQRLSPWPPNRSLSRVLNLYPCVIKVQSVSQCSTADDTSFRVQTSCSPAWVAERANSTHRKREGFSPGWKIRYRL